MDKGQSAPLVRRSANDAELDGSPAPEEPRKRRKAAVESERSTARVAQELYGMKPRVRAPPKVAGSNGDKKSGSPSSTVGASRGAQTQASRARVERPASEEGPEEGKTAATTMVKDRANAKTGTRPTAMYGDMGRASAAPAVIGASGITSVSKNDASPDAMAQRNPLADAPTTDDAFSCKFIAAVGSDTTDGHKDETFSGKLVAQNDRLSAGMGLDAERQHSPASSNLSPAPEEDLFTETAASREDEVNGIEEDGCDSMDEDVDDAVGKDHTNDVVQPSPGDGWPCAGQPHRIPSAASDRRLLFSEEVMSVSSRGTSSQDSPANGTPQNDHDHIAPRTIQNSHEPRSDPIPVPTSQAGHDHSMPYLIDDSDDQGDDASEYGAAVPKRGNVDGNGSANSNSNANISANTSANANGSQPLDSDVARFGLLGNPSQWLSGDIVFAIVKVITAMRPLSVYVTATFEDSVSTCNKLLLDILNQPRMDTLLGVLNLGGSHWVLVVFDVYHGWLSESILRVDLFDSLSPQQLDNVTTEKLFGSTRKKLAPFVETLRRGMIKRRGQQVHNGPISIDISLQSSPKQDNFSDCGVAVAVAALYRCAGKSMPDKTAFPVWRSFFLYMMTSGKAPGDHDRYPGQETDADEDSRGGFTLFHHTRREILDLKNSHDIVTFPKHPEGMHIPPAGTQASTSEAMILARILETYSKSLKMECNAVDNTRAYYLDIVNTLDDILRTGKLLQRRQVEEIRALESRRRTFWDTFGDTSHPEIARLDRASSAAEVAARRWATSLQAVADDIYWVSRMLS